MELSWTELEDASGSAEDIPQIIQMLTAEDAEDRVRARETLWSRLVVHGTRYPATPHAIPLLIGTLRHLGPDERTELLEMIAFFAIGDDQDYLLGAFNPERLRSETTNKRHMPDADHRQEFSLQDEGGNAEPKSKRIELQCYDAVGDQIHSVIQLLPTSSPNGRKWILAILGYYPDKSSMSAPAILDLVMREDDEVVLATALISLGLMDTARGDSGATLQRFLNNPVDIIRWGAAIGLGWKGAPEPELAEILVGCVESLNEIPTGVPYYMGRIDILAEEILDRWQASSATLIWKPKAKPDVWLL
ncbi:HEAT repeat domain-containing protein [Nonomuraea sp. NPDC003709]|uniref:HEAT repeat domain-containing protein n=1 Tax=Nonomuraea sp. NPDC003709 TaxID=3154450 RepID=UPI0033A33A57